MKKNLANFFTSIKDNLFTLFIFIMLWGLLSLFFQSYIIPSPIAVFKELPEFFNENFIKACFITFIRVITGFSISFIAGTFISILAFTLKIVDYINLLLVLFQIIPGTVLGIIFLIVLGMGSGVPIALIVFLTTPIISVNIINILRKSTKPFYEVIKIFNGNLKNYIFDLYLPASIPAIRSNLTLGFSLALKINILGEFIGTQSGIGYLLNVAKIYFNMKELFFYLFFIISFMVIFQIFVNFVFLTVLKKYFYHE